MNLFLRPSLKPLFTRRTKRARLRVALACLLACAPASRAQTQTPRPPQEEDVVRVEAGLVQTDVTVVDKQGRHVDGLKAEQFELKVDGRAQPIAFFERVVAGSAAEASQLTAAARGDKPGAATTTVASASTSAPATPADGRGRTVYFFVDNLHLDPESFMRSRQLLLRAVDNELAPGDRAAVVAAGSGFLTPQLTSDKAELKAAVERLSQREGTFRDPGRPPMTEHQALLITQRDRPMTEYFVEAVMREFPGLGRESVEEMVKARAESVIEQAAPLAANTFIALENLVRSAAQVPGRKLVFFVSGGFLLEGPRANSFERLRRVTDAAAREGVLVYTLNARGLVTGFADASEGGSFRPTGSPVSDLSSQDVLYTLAAETGGRALVNSNDLDAGIRRALSETAVYYLLAWQPPKEVLAAGRFKSIEVSIAGRPDLRVLTRRNLAASVSAALARAGTSAPAASPAQEFLSLLANSSATQQSLPAALVLVYRDAPAGPPGFVLTTSVQVHGSALAPPSNDKATAALDFAAVVLDAQGKRVHGSAARVPYVAGAADKQLFHNFTADLTPGRYQVRAGARDAATGRVGSVAQWVEIPDLSGGKFSLSSLMLSEQTDEGETPGAPKGVARRFAQTSRLRFLTYAYNAAPDPANDNTPDLDLKVQVLRNGQPVQVPPLVEVLVEGEDEKKRFPVGAEIPLDDFAAGEYTLQVTVTDRLKKTTATQQSAFVVVE